MLTWAILLKNKTKRPNHPKEVHPIEGRPLGPGHPAPLLSVLLLHKGVGDGLHAILQADEHHRGATTHYEAQLPSVLHQLCWSSGSRLYSMVPSSARLSSGTNPFRMPLASQPPWDFARMVLAMYLDRSKMLPFCLVRHLVAVRLATFLVAMMQLSLSTLCL